MGTVSSVSQPIANFQGDKLYLDTNTFYLFLRAITPNAQSLFREIQQGAFQAYTSALTFDELAYRMVLARIRDKYTGSPLDRLRQHTSVMIAEFYPQLQPRLLQLQSYPNLSVLEVNAADLLACTKTFRIIISCHAMPFTWRLCKNVVVSTL